MLGWVLLKAYRIAAVLPIDGARISVFSPDLARLFTLAKF